MRALKALLLGGAAGGVLAYVAASAAALAATVAGAELDVSAGPLLFVAVDRTAEGSEATFGAGLAVVPAAVGVANLAAARALGRRIR
jgi:hypothetical protein